MVREEQRQKAFQNRVLRKIYGPKRKEVTGEWRKLHYEKLHLYFSPIINRMINKIQENEISRAYGTVGFWWT
jgi:hypothetical protein